MKQKTLLQHIKDIAADDYRLRGVYNFAKRIILSKGIAGYKYNKEPIEIKSDFTFIDGVTLVITDDNIQLINAITGQIADIYHPENVFDVLYRVIQN